MDSFGGAVILPATDFPIVLYCYHSLAHGRFLNQCLKLKIVFLVLKSKTAFLQQMGNRWDAPVFQRPSLLLLWVCAVYSAGRSTGLSPGYTPPELSNINFLRHFMSFCHFIVY